MQIMIYRNADEIAKAAAMVFASTLFEKPDAVLGLATGGTPVPLYRELVRLNKARMIDFSRARTYNLDEYVGLAPDHPSSYRHFMDVNLFNEINIDKGNTHVPSGLGDAEQNAKAYDAEIESAGGIDLQLLGIGHNGHIGFNEPSDRFIYETNVTALTQSTIDANLYTFSNPAEMPNRAISLGIGGIMGAKRVLMLATGKGKAEAIRAAIKGDVTPSMPASILRLHPNVQFMLDEAAASLL